MVILEERLGWYILKLRWLKIVSCGFNMLNKLWKVSPLAELIKLVWEDEEWYENLRLYR